MSQHPNWSSRGDDDRSARSVDRRGLLRGGTVAATLAVAGCLGDTFTSGSADDHEDDPEDDPGGEEETLEDELFAVLDRYFEASAEGDLDAIDDVMHSRNPMNPAAWEEDGWEYQGGDGEVPAPFEGEVVTTDGTVDDVLELEDAEFWFRDVDLDEELGDERIAIVRADRSWLEETADATEGDGDDEIGVSHDFEDGPEADTWVLVTEDGEWRILFTGAEDDTPEDPTEAFEEEIIDEDEAVVAAIDWEYERDDQPEDDDVFADVEMARVTFADDPGLEADAVRAESTIEGGHVEFSNGWSGAWGTVTFNPDGDQIVVRIARDGEETIVHREHHLPDAAESDA